MSSKCRARRKEHAAYLGSEVPEEEDVVLPDLFGDLDARPVYSTEDEAAVQAELHVAGA